jgi:transcriptional regulator with XRE-family HTH domain
MPKTFSLGKKLRALREERGLSQRELAKLSGISANAVSLIERDENSPSVATLQRLASALNIKMSYFFEDAGKKNILHIQADQRPHLTSKGTRIESAGERLHAQELEPFFVTLEPHSGSGERQVVHTGHEFVFCVHGQVEYIIDGEVFILDPGDFLLFEAHLPHHWQNPNQNPASFVLVLQTPKESSETVKRHFSSYPSIDHMG